MAARRGPARPFRRWAAGVLLLVLVGCASADERSSPPTGIRVASFDFVENQLLAELYATALERGGYDVVRLRGLGPREVVSPALQQGLVDLVPEYAGSALRFLDAAAAPQGGPAPADPAGALRAALQSRGLAALALAPGEDQNGVAVTSDTAEEHGLRTLSDLVVHAPGLSFGGPAECRERPLCLPGLEQRYGLRFETFVPFTSRAATAEALLAGQLDVGMLETVDAYLADGRLVLLQDDRRLQPPENVVPVLREDVVREHGTGLVELLDAVTARLTTRAMAALNQQVVLEGTPVADVAAEWVDMHRIGGVRPVPTPEEG